MIQMTPMKKRLPGLPQGMGTPAMSPPPSGTAPGVPGTPPPTARDGLSNAALMQQNQNLMRQQSGIMQPQPPGGTSVVPNSAIKQNMLQRQQLIQQGAMSKLGTSGMMRTKKPLAQPQKGAPTSGSMGQGLMSMFGQKGI